jgi:hypothetical protein
MLKIHKIADQNIAELIDKNYVISGTQDVLDLIGESDAEDCRMFIINEHNLHPEFFRLQSGLAGEILQKFSNYRFRLAIIGDFSKYKSKSLADFIRESNKGRSIFFVNNLDDALSNLSKYR